MEGLAISNRVELLRLRFDEGLDMREIAARWDESSEAVKLAYRKARKEFRECLREVVAFHHPGHRNTERECKRLLTLLG